MSGISNLHAVALFCPRQPKSACSRPVLSASLAVGYHTRSGYVEDATGVRMLLKMADRNALVDSLGLACYIAWSYVFWDSPLFIAMDVGPFTAGQLLLTQGVFTGVAALVLMFLWGRFAPLRRNVLVMGAFALMAVGSVVLTVLGSAEGASALVLASFALSGAGSAMRLGWEERMSVRGVRAAAVRAGLGYVVGSLLYAAVIVMPFSLAVTVTALLPMASLVLLVHQETHRADDGLVLPDPALQPVGARASFAACFERVPWRIPAFIALAYFCYGATRMTSLGQSLAATSASGALTVVVAMLACSVGVLLAYVSYRRSVRAGIYVAVPILAGAGMCYVLGVPGVDLAVLFVANVGVEVTKYLMLFLMIDVIIKDGAPALLCLALLRFAQWIGSALGQVAVSVVPAGVTGIAISILLVLVVALVLVMDLSPARSRGPLESKNDGATVRGLRQKSAKAEASRDAAASGAACGGVEAVEGVGSYEGRSRGRREGGVSSPLDGEKLSARVARAAQTYGLSPRETEVLGIWATGRPISYVEKALFISQNTVKTHLNHIYSKTGTANRGELLELLSAIDI